MGAAAPTGEGPQSLQGDDARGSAIAGSATPPLETAIAGVRGGAARRAGGASGPRLSQPAGGVHIYAIRTASLESLASEAPTRDVGLPVNAIEGCIRRGLLSLRATLGGEATINQRLDASGDNRVS